MAAKAQQTIDDTITVIVPTLGREALKATLSALSDNNVLPVSVVLIDQSEYAPIEDWCVSLRSQGVRVDCVRAPALGPSRARNRAMERVTTPYFASIDDDCAPDADWLEALTRRLRADPGALVSGRVEAPEGALAPSTKVSEAEQIFSAPYDGDPLLTGNFAGAITVAAMIGLFDEQLITAEDNDWAYRALRLGIPIIYAPEARVTHNNPLTGDEMAEVEQRYALGQGMFMGKHMASGDLFIAKRFIGEASRLTRSFLRAAIKHEGPAQKRAAQRLQSFLRGARRGLSKRRSSKLDASVPSDGPQRLAQ